MFRTLFIAFLTFFLLTAPAHAADEGKVVAGPSIAFVDMVAILKDSKAAQDIQKQLQEKQKSFETDFAGREKALREAQKTFAEGRANMTQEQLAEKGKEFQKQFEEVRQLVQKRRRALDESSDKAMAELRKHVVEVSSGIAKDKGYQIVLTRQDVIVVEKNFDITDQVLAGLDKKVSKIKIDVKAD